MLQDKTKNVVPGLVVNAATALEGSWGDIQRFKICSLYVSLFSNRIFHKVMVTEYFFPNVFAMSQIIAPITKRQVEIGHAKNTRLPM